MRLELCQKAYYCTYNKELYNNKITPMPNKITDIKLTSPLMRNPKNNSNKHNAATTPIKLILGEYN